MTIPFILGLRKSVPDSPYLTTEELFARVGHNTGNLAFHFAIDQQLGPDLPVVPWRAGEGELNGSGDMAVLPCANQLGAHTDYGGMAKKLTKLRHPMIAIGLGAQASAGGKMPEVPRGTLDWVAEMSAHSADGAPNISVRGQFTQDVLAHYKLADKTVVLGCPSLFINPDPALGARIAAAFRKPERVAVTSGHQGWKHLARLEASLARLATETGGSYVGQSALEMIMLTRGEAAKLPPETLAECRDYAMPGMPLDEFARWSRTYGNVFFDIPGWMEHYRHFDFVIGTRIHGVMLALQAGVPALCIAHDSRTVELCSTMKVPFVTAASVIEGVSLADIPRLFEFDAAAFDANRLELARRYAAFLEGNRISSYHLPA